MTCGLVPIAPKSSIPLLPALVILYLFFSQTAEPLVKAIVKKVASQAES
jgi:hypothetical protein